MPESNWPAKPVGVVVHSFPSASSSILVGRLPRDMAMKPICGYSFLSEGIGEYDISFEAGYYQIFHFLKDKPIQLKCKFPLFLCSIRGRFFFFGLTMQQVVRLAYLLALEILSEILMWPKCLMILLFLLVRGSRVPVFLAPSSILSL